MLAHYWSWQFVGCAPVLALLAEFGTSESDLLFLSPVLSTCFAQSFQCSVLFTSYIDLEKSHCLQRHLWRFYHPQAWTPIPLAFVWQRLKQVVQFHGFLRCVPSGSGLERCRQLKLGLWSFATQMHMRSPCNKGASNVNSIGWHFQGRELGTTCTSPAPAIPFGFRSFRPASLACSS